MIFLSLIEFLAIISILEWFSYSSYNNSSSMNNLLNFISFSVWNQQTNWCQKNNNKYNYNCTWYNNILTCHLQFSYIKKFLFLPWSNRNLVPLPVDSLSILKIWDFKHWKIFICDKIIQVIFPFHIIIKKCNEPW